MEKWTVRIILKEHIAHKTAGLRSTNGCSKFSYRADNPLTTNRDNKRINGP